MKKQLKPCWRVGVGWCHLDADAIVPDGVESFVTNKNSFGRKQYLVFLRNDKQLC